MTNPSQQNEKKPFSNDEVRSAKQDGSPEMPDSNEESEEAGNEAESEDDSEEDAESENESKPAHQI